MVPGKAHPTGAGVEHQRASPSCTLSSPAPYHSRQLRPSGKSSGSRRTDLLTQTAEPSQARGEVKPWPFSWGHLPALRPCWARSGSSPAGTLLRGSAHNPGLGASVGSRRQLAPRVLGDVCPTCRLNLPPCDPCLLSLLGPRVSPPILYLSVALMSLFNPPSRAHPRFYNSLLSRRLGSTPAPLPRAPGPTHPQRGAGRARPARRAGAACCRPAERSAASPRRRAPGAAPTRPQEMLASRAKIPGRLRALRLARSAPSGDPAGRRGRRASLGASPAASPPRPGARESGRGRGLGSGLPLPAPGAQEPISQTRTLKSSTRSAGPRTCTPRTRSVEAFLRPLMNRSLIPSDGVWP